MYVFGSGRSGGEWMRGFGFCVTNPVRTGGVLVVCLGCGGIGRRLVPGSGGVVDVMSV